MQQQLDCRPTRLFSSFNHTPRERGVKIDQAIPLIARDLAEQLVSRLFMILNDIEVKLFGHLVALSQALTKAIAPSQLFNAMRRGKPFHDKPSVALKAVPAIALDDLQNRSAAGTTFFGVRTANFLSQALLCHFGHILTRTLTVTQTQTMLKAWLAISGSDNGLRPAFTEKSLQTGFLGFCKRTGCEK